MTHSCAKADRSLKQLFYLWASFSVLRLRIDSKVGLRVNRYLVPSDSDFADSDLRGCMGVCGAVASRIPVSNVPHARKL